MDESIVEVALQEESRRERQRWNQADSKMIASSSVLTSEEAESGVILDAVVHADSGRGVDTGGGRERPVLGEECFRMRKF